ncbi:MAG: hypothetical protein AB1414_18370, partial [bacterium]
MSKKVMLIGLVVWLIFMSASAYSFWPFTVRSDMISYHAPCWGDNNKIYFIKKVTFGHAVIPYAFNIIIFMGGSYFPDKTEVYLCSMNYDGTDKKEIVKIGDTDDDTYWLPMYLDYCKANNLLLLSGGVHPARGTGDQGIYTIQTDGRRLKKISDKGMYADWSPDGKRIVYGGGTIMNADGTNHHPIIPE